MRDRRAELEDMIDEHPDEATNYVVLADHLQEVGDRRGEAIIRWRDAKASDRAALGRQLEMSLGPQPPQYGGLEWFYGYVRTVHAIVDEDDAGKLAELFAHPSLRHLQRVELSVAGGLYDDELAWIVDLLAKRQRPCWRELWLHCYVRGGNEPPRGDLDLAPLWSAMPRLRKLRATARHIDPGSLDCPTLEILELDGGVTSEALQPLLHGAMPKLRELHLHDIPRSAIRQIESSPLAERLEKGTLKTADRDRYEQTGE